MRTRLGVLCLAVIALVGCSDGNQGAQPSPQRAPNFEITTFKGEEFALADHRGTPVVLNFWESW